MYHTHVRNKQTNTLYKSKYLWPLNWFGTFYSMNQTFANIFFRGFSSKSYFNSILHSHFNWKLKCSNRVELFRPTRIFLRQFDLPKKIYPNPTNLRRVKLEFGSGLPFGFDLAYPIGYPMRIPTESPLIQ